MLKDEASIAREALEEACASADADSVTMVVHRHLWPLYDRHLAALQEAIVTLSAQDLARYPLLQVLHPMGPALAGSSRPIDVRSLGEAPVLDESGRDAIVVMQILAARMNGDLRASSGYARELAARVYQTDVPERAQRGSILWFLHCEIGSALLMIGDTAAAIRELTTAREVGRLSGSPDGERVALGRLAMAEILRGSVGSAARSLAAGHALPPLTETYATEGRATEAVVASLIALERASASGEIDPEALSGLESTAFSWAFATLARARHSILLGRPIEALETVRVASGTHHVQDGTLPADILARAYIEVFLLLGLVSAAEESALSVRTPGPMLISQLTRLDLIRGDVDAAAERLRAIGSTRLISPVNETEITCLRVWEMVARGAVSADLARRFALVALNPDLRRVVRMVPRWVVDEVRPLVPANLREDFEAAKAQIAFVELGQSSPHLTDSERRVIAVLPQHERIADLAAALFLSPNTVKTHLNSLYRKLGVSSRREAIEMRDALMRDEPARGEDDANSTAGRG